MDFGIPKETRDQESRVGLTPPGVDALTRYGHRVWIQSNAGQDAGFSDDEFDRVGGKIVYSAEEVYVRSTVVAKVARPTEKEYALFQKEQTLVSFLHMAVASPDLLEALREKSMTAIGYETIETVDRTLPVLMATSEVAGRLASVIAGQLLTSQWGGRGILLGGIPGVPPAAVVIVGAGVVGLNALRSFLGMQAQITILDSEQSRLRHVDQLYPDRVSTMLAYPYNIEKAVAFADVLVLCVYAPGRRAPVLVTREMVAQMKPGSALIDYSIDQGGASETSRPTSLRDPVYREQGVIHYCVPNMPALAGRTASYALTNAALPYLVAIGEHGVDNAIQQKPELRRGVNLYRGRLANPELAASIGMELEIDLFKRRAE